MPAGDAIQLTARPAIGFILRGRQRFRIGSGGIGVAEDRAARGVEVRRHDIAEKGGAGKESSRRGPPKWLTRAKAGLAKFLAYVVRDRAEGSPKWKGFTLPNENAETTRSPP